MIDEQLIIDTSQSKELHFLLTLLREENRFEEIIPLKEIDWNHFLELVKHHRVCPLIYIRLKGTPDAVPPYVIEALFQEYKKNTFKMLQLTGEMETLDKVFNENDIETLCLKGPPVAYELFKNISLRMSKDLDILVREEDLEKAESILFSLGYEKEEILTVLNEIKWRHHHIAYYHPEKKIQVEVHWRLHPRSMKRTRFEELWNGKRESQLTKHPISFMGTEDLLLYLISHGGRHGWFRLRWLKDIDQMVRNKDINYVHFKELAVKHQQKDLVGQAFQLANLFFQTPVHEELQGIVNTKRANQLAKKALPFIKEMVQLHVHPQPKNLETSYKNYLFSIKTKRQKCKFLIISFYPTPLDERTFKLPKSLHFAYFLLRPFLWSWRKLKEPMLS
ncbi:nucleotidyltransferase domain-containing protein [Priestia megaterium]|uniref:nucleotidyltransferase domain-containing protein n=1 Tax=Priestia megaterium TaxID=1404 RepID=UPI000BFCEDBA|nr:nucleotidyltransferase family protein [Priestia megaterium]MCM3018669.1 nucleotidyltransferase family protein [Priestia megaterium]PGY51830.1 Renal dipeptidase [Priestia megaterium]